jgi:hypothetical protein
MDLGHTVIHCDKDLLYELATTTSPSVPNLENST